jgi:multiple antibiotic resistance protein
MLEFAQDFIMAFVPLFVAIDPLGMAGMFLGLTQDMNPAHRRKVAAQAAATAFATGLVFMFAGRFIFQAIGITIADFLVAGGLVLLIVAIRSLLDQRFETVHVDEDFGVVPLGLPLIAGPAMLSALLVLTDQVGVLVTLAAMAANLLLVFVSFAWAPALKQVVGTRGLRAVSKIIALLLVAIAVNMIRRGWQEFL